MMYKASIILPCCLKLMLKYLHHKTQFHHQCLTFSEKIENIGSLMSIQNFVSSVKMAITEMLVTCPTTCQARIASTLGTGSEQVGSHTTSSFSIIYKLVCQLFKSSSVSLASVYRKMLKMFAESYFHPFHLHCQWANVRLAN